MKALHAFCLFVLAAALLAGCGNGGTADQDTGAGETSPRGVIQAEVTSVVEVPDSVRGMWKEVVLVIRDKQQGSTEEYTVPIGATLSVPDSDLKIEVKEFFPAFAMQGSTITSVSNEPNNPAALVTVKEGGAGIFSGWLFARFPTTHALSHPRFAITLKEGVPKK